jgi:hypothetical protein
MPSQPAGTPGTYGDSLRSKGVQIDAGQAKSHRSGEDKRDSNARFNNWERGVTGEHRPDGTFMPYLDTSGDVIRNKQMSEGTFDKAKTALHELRSGAIPTGESHG